MTPPAPRIAIFGGTFDPIHDGHLEIASKAVQELRLDQVIFVPCQQSPHKTTGPVADDQTRFDLLNLATQELSWAIVSDHELKETPPSYTWKTVDHFRNEIPTATFFLLIGNDQWQALERWQNYRALAEKVEFIVVGRTAQPTPKPGIRATFIEGNHPASASEIRRDLHLGKSPQWLPSSVTNYLRKKTVYSASL